MTIELKQSWPVPAAPKPVVIVGAGGIIRDAHLPAYQKADILVGGVTDVDVARAQSLAAEYDIPTIHASLADAVAAHATNAIYDIATPPHVIAAILPDLPDGAAVLIQKPMGTD